MFLGGGAVSYERGTPVDHGAIAPGAIQCYLAHKKTPILEDHHRALGISLLYGPRGGCFIMSEVPLCAARLVLSVSAEWLNRGGGCS